MTIRELLGRLVAEGRLDPAVLDDTTPAGAAARTALAAHARGAVRVQQAGSSASVWFGAALLAAFLIANDIHELPLLAILLGGVALALAAGLARQPPTLLGLQLIWIAVIFGQILILAGIGEQADGVTLALAAVALQAITIAAVRNLAVGAAAVAVAVGALVFLIDELNLEPFGYDLLALSLGACVCALWVLEARLAGALGRLWQPLAYALPVALLLPLTVATAGDRVEPTIRAAGTAGWGLLSIWLIGQAGREAPELRGRPQMFAGAAVLLAAAVGWRAPGLAAGVALLVLSHLRRSPALQTLALATIGGFLFFWYYGLGTTLLAKSLAAVGNGLVFLLAAGVLRRGAARPREREVRPLAARIGELRWLALALGLALAVPAAIVADKERVIAGGETALLRLRPVDPRSLIQGDYMRLAYALVDDIPAPETLPLRGALVITRDADGVARFVRVDDGRPLAPGELYLRYARRGAAQVTLGAESFFFPEGQGDALTDARYGELALGPAGDSVLIGLRDEHRRPLGPRLHDRAP